MRNSCTSVVPNTCALKLHYIMKLDRETKRKAHNEEKTHKNANWHIIKKSRQLNYPWLWYLFVINILWYLIIWLEFRMWLYFCRQYTVAGKVSVTVDTCPSCRNPEINSATHKIYVNKWYCLWKFNQFHRKYSGLFTWLFILNIKSRNAPVSRALVTWTGYQSYHRSGNLTLPQSYNNSFILHRLPELPQIW